MTTSRPSSNTWWGSDMRPAAAIREIFGFFFGLGRRAGRTRTFVILGLVPVAMAVAARIFLHGRAGDMAAVSTEILMVFFLQFYIVLVTLFYGTSIKAEEVENRTLSYLLTRPVPKTAIILGKFSAYAAMTSAMVAVGLGVSFFILNAPRMGDFALYVTFLRYLGVLVLGIL